MGSKMTFITLSWRREETTLEQFANHYERSYLPFISTLVPPIYERSYPVASSGTTLANQPKEGIFSFDSLTAVTFNAQLDIETRAASLADEPKRRLEIDEDDFTRRDRQVTYVAETESSASSDDKQLSSSAVNILLISRQRPGIERAQFKLNYEAEISASGNMFGELRHTRYYLLPEHLLSYSGGAWGEEPKSAMDVVQDITFRNQEATEQGIEKLRAAALDSNAIDKTATVMFYTRRVLGIPSPPPETSHNHDDKTAKETEVKQISGEGASSAKSWAVIAKFDLNEGCEAEWMQLVGRVIDAMKHEKTFISTSMCAHPSQQGKFMLFEVWEDRDEFFTTQVHRDYRRALMERLPELIRSPVVFDEWTEIRADFSKAIHKRH